MKKLKLYSPAIFLLLLALLPSASAAQIAYGHGEPSNDEQYMLELINRTRANPAVEAQILANSSDPFVKGDLYVIGGGDVVGGREKLIEDFSKYPSRPPLAFNSILMQTASAHTKYMALTNTIGHDEGNIDPETRVRSAANGVLGFIGENVGVSSTPFIEHAALLIDAGKSNIDQLHRKTILDLNPGLYSNVIGIGGIYLTTATPTFAVTEDFGNYPNQTFVTGVVYEDLNNNSEYDPGEGVEGITIQPSSGNYYAVTSSSGGYAIPIDPQSRAAITLTAAGGALNAPYEQKIALNGQNVKGDFVVSIVDPTPVQLTAVNPVDSVSQKTFSGIQITRNLNVDQPVRLNFKLKGSAIYKTDYKMGLIDADGQIAKSKNLYVDFAAGQDTQTLVFVPKKTMQSESETVKLKIVKSGVNQKAQVTVAISK